MSGQDTPTTTGLTPTPQESADFVGTGVWPGRHFRVEEFESPDEPGSGWNISMELVRNIDELRDMCKFPLVINSGYRTAFHNTEVGGKPSSVHLTGEAVDIHCNSSRRRKIILGNAFKLGFNRVGIGKTFIHLDISKKHDQNVVWLY